MSDRVVRQHEYQYLAVTVIQRHFQIEAFNFQYRKSLELTQVQRGYARERRQLWNLKSIDQTYGKELDRRTSKPERTNLPTIAAYMPSPLMARAAKK